MHFEWRAIVAEFGMLLLKENRTTKGGWMRFVCLLAILTAVSCATGRVPHAEPIPLPTDLYCESDDDCEVLDHSVYGDCCWGGWQTEPYAISRAAEERHRTELATKCADAVCDEPLMGYPRGRLCRTGLDEWTPVCSGHVCKRRSIHLFLPEKTVECDD
jgi:hypothetical protein